MNTSEFRDYVFGIRHSSYGINDLRIPDNLKKDFFEWVKKRGIFFGGTNSVSPVELSSKANFLEASMCFNNSQRVSMLDQSYEYYEGFYHVYLTPPVHRHAFNVKTGCIKDFTAEFSKINPLFYFGIQIPKEVIDELLGVSLVNPQSVMKERHNNSLIMPYFFYTIGRMDLVKVLAYYAPETPR